MKSLKLAYLSFLSLNIFLLTIKFYLLYQIIKKIINNLIIKINLFSL